MNNHMDQGIFFPLYGDFDKKLFQATVSCVKRKCKFLGGEDDRKFFLKYLLISQMLKDYRKPLELILAACDRALEKIDSSMSVDLQSICNEIRTTDLELDFSWAIWKRDKEMGEISEKLMDMDLNMSGENIDYDEFVLRYLISIWLVDWEGPMYAVLKMVENGNVNLPEINLILRNWDFTGIFGEW